MIYWKSFIYGVIATILFIGDIHLFKNLTDFVWFMVFIVLLETP
jgi:hypothetical protein